jgi:hypothetical protein
VVPITNNNYDQLVIPRSLAAGIRPLLPLQGEGWDGGGVSAVKHKLPLNTPRSCRGVDQRLLEGESQTLEFKTSFDKTTAESLVAFANAQSGFIRIRKALRDYPELSLNTQEISGGIMLTFAQINIEQPESRSEKIDSGGQVTGQVTAEIVRLLNIVHGEMSRQQLQDALALKSRDNFDKRYLKPALLLSLIEPTMPDKPNSRHQKYRLTVAGQAQQLNQKAKHK